MPGVDADRQRMIASDRILAVERGRDRNLQRFGAGGPFLFGAFTAADAMYAPVVARLHTYAVEVGAPARAYMDAMMALPAWKEWTAAALKEEWVVAEDEIDWPTVLRV